MILSIIIVFVLCSLIELIRKMTVEKKISNFFEFVLKKHFMNIIDMIDKIINKAINVKEGSNK
ncbi:MAG: hypothetical protein IKJ43_00400 [Bacilli bacterium]|nr:hypothetical protein [Bacilli bacterium]